MGHCDLVRPHGLKDPRVNFMKFVQRDLGEAAEASSGAGSRGLLGEITKLAGLSLLCIAVIYILLMLAADRVVGAISVEQEAKLFADFDPKLTTFNPDETGHTGEAALCRNILARLAAADGAPPLAFRLLFADDIQPNAFAIPGGTIGVTRGLLDAIEGEIAIAFVLAHEMGHFHHRHHLKGIARQLGAGLTLGLLFGDSGVSAIASNATEAVNLAYSRSQEREADEFGVRLLLRVYNTTTGADALFAHLDRAGRLPRWAYMFSTHPDHKERIDNLRRIAAEESSSR